MECTFGIVGGGWRSEFFLRIARDLPERFPLAGVVVRNPEKRVALHRKWGVPVFGTVEELLPKSSFIVTSVPWAANLPLLELLAEKNIPVLSETPIAPQLTDLRKVWQLVEGGAKIQVAEQYLFQPMHAARLKLVNSGRLGPISDVNVSIAHGYHGISLLRHYLQVGLQLPKVSARKFASKIVAGPGRNGPPEKLTTANSERIIAHLDYGDRLGVYDFAGEQYFSWIRSPHLQVRGEKGEINQETLRELLDFQSPLKVDLIRRDTGHDGNLEGYSHQAILAGTEILYRSPFPTARWSDEIAVATSLDKMKSYVASGEDFYGVAEACHDRYLDLLISEAANSGREISGEAQPWMKKL